MYILIRLLKAVSVDVSFTGGIKVRTRGVKHMQGYVIGFFTGEIMTKEWNHENRYKDYQKTLPNIKGNCQLLLLLPETPDIMEVLVARFLMYQGHGSCKQSVTDI